MERSRKILLSVGGAAIFAAAFGVYGLPMISAQLNLASLKTTTDQLLKGTKMSPTQPTQPAVILATFEQKHPDISKELNNQNSMETARQIVNDSASPEILNAVIESTKNIDLTVYPKSAIFDFEVRTIRTMGRALIEKAENDFANNKTTDALSTLKIANEIATNTAKVGEMQSIITSFIIQIEIYRTLTQKLNHKDTTAAQVSEIKEFLDTNTEQVTVLDALKRNIQELYAASEHFRKYNSNDIGTLNSELINDRPPRDHPATTASMQSGLIEYYAACKKEFDESPDSEYAGVIFDTNFKEWSKNTDDKYYMIRTIGEVYEQLGRNISRVSQAKRVAKICAYVKTQQLETGKIPPALPSALTDEPEGKDTMIVDYQPQSDDSFTITCMSTSRKDREIIFKPGEFVVSQETGVRYTSPTP